LQELTEEQLVKTQIAVGGHSELPLDGLRERYLSPGIRIPVPEDCRPPVGILFGQSLGPFFLVRCNLTPDGPSPNGASSRVVQNVRILLFISGMWAIWIVKTAFPTHESIINKQNN
jgi:tagatose-6-phosphate ketose/aldose isomerase